MLIRTLRIAIGVCLASPAAYAAGIPLPSYDAPAFCAAAAARWADQSIGNCLENERLARVFLISIWPSVEEETKARCVTKSANNNFGLSICLTGETKNQALWGKTPPTIQEH